MGAAQISEKCHFLENFVNFGEFFVPFKRGASRLFDGSWQLPHGSPMAPHWLPNSHLTAPPRIPEGTIWHSLLLKSVVKVAGPGETVFVNRPPEKHFLTVFTH